MQLSRDGLFTSGYVVQKIVTKSESIPPVLAKTTGKLQISYDIYL
jgi:hypothetical protein